MTVKTGAGWGGADGGTGGCAVGGAAGAADGGAVDGDGACCERDGTAPATAEARARTATAVKVAYATNWGAPLRRSIILQCVAPG